MGGCPLHNSGDGEQSDEQAETGQPEQGPDDRRRGRVERREFVKSALLIGGASAVSSLGSIAGITTNARAAEAERITAAARLNRQHAWDAFEPVVGSGNSLQPKHSLFLMLDYQGRGEPSVGHRRQVETALTELERHFEWSPEGILFTMGYSAAYFDRFDESLPPGAAPDDQETVAETVAELTDLADTNNDITPDTYDAVLLLSSENEANLLDAEAALWGESENLDFEATFEGIFEKPAAWPDRRVGFGGPGFQDREEEYEEAFLDGEDQIPDEAPLSMGFIAGFGASIPEEEAVTLKQSQVFPSADVDSTAVPTDIPYVDGVSERDPGVFAQGTLKHLSHLEIDLSEWYGDGLDSDNRHQMYSPYHTEEETNDAGGDKPGSGLVDPDAEEPNDVGPDATEAAPERTTLEYAELTEDTASGEDEAMLPEDEDGEKLPTAGHSQKAARARYDIDGDGEAEQPVLRRDWDAVTETDGEETAGYLFNVPMRFNESVYSMLDANYNVGFTSLDGSIDHEPADNDVIKERSGIAPFLSATRRGNWLVPPVTVRALPYPKAERATLSIAREGGSYVVEVTDLDRSGGAIDPETVRFGAVEDVNRARGAEPTDVSRRRGTLTFTFPADETGLSGAGGETAKLFGKREGSRKPVTGTETT